MGRESEGSRLPRGLRRSEKFEEQLERASARPTGRRHAEADRPDVGDSGDRSAPTRTGETWLQFRQKQEPCGRGPVPRAHVPQRQAASRPRAAKAQDDDVDVRLAGEPTDGSGRSSHDCARLDLTQARRTAQLIHAQTEPTGFGARPQLLFARQLAVQDERVEASFLGASQEARADGRGELWSHLERPEAGTLLRADCCRRLRVRGCGHLREGGKGHGEKKDAAPSDACGCQHRLRETPAGMAVQASLVQGIRIFSSARHECALHAIPLWLASVAARWPAAAPRPGAI